MAEPRCSIDGCLSPAWARGRCNAHYKQWRRSEAWPGLAHTKRGAAMEWLLAHANYQGDDCLKWPFPRCDDGYCAFQKERKKILAHRFMCLLAYGEPPTPKHESAHNCGNGHEGCLNPKHLRWATMAENKADELLHGTRNRGERNGQSKLTAMQVREILALAGTLSKAKIARRYGVSEGAIREILAHRNWTWVHADMRGAG